MAAPRSRSPGRAQGGGGESGRGEATLSALAQRWFISCDRQAFPPTGFVLPVRLGLGPPGSAGEVPPTSPPTWGGIPPAETRGGERLLVIRIPRRRVTWLPPAGCLSGRAFPLRSPMLALRSRWALGRGFQQGGRQRNRRRIGQAAGACPGPLHFFPPLPPLRSLRWRFGGSPSSRIFREGPRRPERGGVRRRRCLDASTHTWPHLATWDGRGLTLPGGFGQGRGWGGVSPWACIT